MNFRYLKIMATPLALAFVSQGCFFVVDRDRHRHRRHSSLDQSTPSVAQLANQNGEDSGHERK